SDRPRGTAPSTPRSRSPPPSPSPTTVPAPLRMPERCWSTPVVHYHLGRDVSSHRGLRRAACRRVRRSLVDVGLTVRHGYPDMAEIELAPLSHRLDEDEVRTLTRLLAEAG